MRRLVASTGIVAGILLAVVPRYVLPPCGSLGYPRMHCSDTARVEILLGFALTGVGVVAAAARKPWLLMASAAASAAILAMAWFAPDVYGYCMSPRMPCHYGMVPGVRFISALAGTILFISMLLAARRKTQGS